MKITGDRNNIWVELDQKILKIEGELTLTAFYADVSSIRNWEKPHEHLLISEQERSEIIEKIMAQNEANEMKIYFK